MIDESKISYNIIHFDFAWEWIKDKQIIHRGNRDYGMLMIIDKDGIPVKMYGYECINETNE